MEFTTDADLALEQLIKLTDTSKIIIGKLPAVDPNELAVLLATICEDREKRLRVLEKYMVRKIAEEE